MEIKKLHELYLTCSGVSTDTRKISDGTMFFALKGDNFDGNDFATKAVAAGARYAVVSRLPKIGDDHYILVDDTLAALRALAKYHREQFNIPVIGITGTNGKTTTKELVNAVLGTTFKTLCTEGNLNNHIGVPLTLLRLGREHQIAIVEMGASHSGEIKDSVELVRPGFGLVTNVGEAHLEGFGSFEGVKKTKGELYDWLAMNSGTAFYNADNEYLLKMLQERKVEHLIAYGLAHSNSAIAPVSTEHPALRLEYDGGRCTVNTSLIGSYNADNVLAAIAVGCHFGVTLENAVAAVEAYTPSNSRSQMVKTESNLLIVDAYNANVASMKASLNNFAATGFTGKTLILGDMLELGEYSEKAHRDILHLAHTITDEIFLVGRSEFRKVAGGEKIFDSSADLKEYIASHPLNGRTVLIKGSNSNKLGILIDVL